MQCVFLVAMGIMVVPIAEILVIHVAIQEEMSFIREPENRQEGEVGVEETEVFYGDADTNSAIPVVEQMPMLDLVRMEVVSLKSVENISHLT